MLILWAIDVGQGDGLLLRMPTGEHVLVDSGVNTDKNAVPDFLREKGVEEIEYAVFTHPHCRHIGAAAEVVRGFRVKNVYMARTSRIRPRPIWTCSTRSRPTNRSASAAPSRANRFRSAR